MVHYHLTNKNLSWAQVRDAGACLLPLQEKVGGGQWPLSCTFTSQRLSGSRVMEGLCLLVTSFPTRISLPGSMVLSLGGHRPT